jgi:hypothetical protein
LQHRLVPAPHSGRGHVLNEEKEATHVDLKFKASNIFVICLIMLTSVSSTKVSGMALQVPEQR